MKAVRYAKGDMIDYTPVAAVSAGDVIVFNDRMVAIADHDIAAGVKGALAVEGIYDVCKESIAFVVGEDVYWDEDAQRAFSGITVGGAAAIGAYIGKCVKDAIAADDTVKVKLVQQLESASGTATGTGTAGDEL